MTKRSLQTVGAVPVAHPGRALVTAGATLIAVTYGMVRYGYGLHLPQLTAEFGLSPRTAGAIASGSFAAYCVAALLAQGLLVRRGARTVLWLAAALAAAGAVVVALAASAPVLALGVLVAGGAAGAASPALVVAVVGTVRERLVARAQALVNAGTGAGVALTGAGVLLAPQAWRPVWLAAAVLALLSAAAVHRLASWPTTDPRPEPQPEPQPEPGPPASLLRPVVAAGTAGVGAAAVWTFGRDLVTTTGGLPERTTALLWCVLGMAAVLGALSGDAVRWLGLRGAWALTTSLTAGGTVVLVLVPDRPVLAGVAGAVFGGGYTALSGVLIAWASALRPAEAGQTTATLFIALTAGQALGAGLTGVLVERWGVQVAFGACAALVLLAGAVLPVSGRRA